MEQNGKDSLTAPLLQSPESIAVDFSQGSSRSDKRTRKVTFRIGGMECASCAASIESVVGNMKGVESVFVSPLQGQAVIKYRPEFINVSWRKYSCLIS